MPPVCISIAQNAAGNPIATGRLLADGHIGHFGRIAVLTECRGHGVGAATFEYLIAAAIRRGRSELQRNAQSHAIGLHARYGFAPCGPEFVEAGMSHLPMLR